MITSKAQSNATIFLSYDREVSKRNGCTSFSFFNNPTRWGRLDNPFRELYSVSEEVLDESATMQLNTDADTLMMILPVNGAVSLSKQGRKDKLIAAGQLYFIPVKDGEQVQVKNPFSNGLVNFIRLCYRTGPGAPAHTATASFDVNKYPACMMRISPAYIDSFIVPFRITIGKFAGRMDTVYDLSDPTNTVFVLVLSGAFEVQGRLLQECDALSICGEPQLDAEALSNEAILLMIEWPFVRTSV